VSDQKPLTGFAFTILDGGYDGQRLRFDIAPRELWKDWCEDVVDGGAVGQDPTSGIVGPS
jgi:hypothetical protein